MTHQLWEGVGLSLWGRVGQVQKAVQWCVQPPPQWGGGDGDDDGAVARDDGRDELHQHEPRPPPPGGASHVPLPAFRAHDKETPMTHAATAHPMH